MHSAEPDWAQLRAEFDLTPDYVHLALSMLTAHPRPVREAIERHRRGLDTNPALYFHRRDELHRAVLERAGAYLGAHPDAIALTESTTMGLAVVYGGFRLKPGEEILSTEHEHYAATELLRFKAASSGAAHRTIRLYEDPRQATVAEIVSAVRHGLGERTRVLALTWVHSGTGVKLPLAEISAVVAEHNRHRPADEQVVVCVDAVHGLGVEDFEVADLGCDFFVAGCHKWLFGPRGTGLVWGSDRGWQAVEPVVTSFDVEVFWPWYLGRLPDLEAPKARMCTPGGFPAYEHRWALAEAFDFHLARGKNTINARIAQLNAHCQARLAELPGVRVRTPAAPQLSSGMVCLDVPGLDPAEVVERMLHAGVIVGQTPYRSSAVRIAPGVLNSVQDIDRAVDALARVIDEHGR
ncbi:aminotransferase class V-fold PLP-dependent enzyme [Saccharopolyspora indica]|uniref:aminotransferase class V-fold PLP-dependent enzyme n=1 Tax=Saccharopolyspora indica TaxID=1229659 RepID=UPI0022EAFC0D|nr:aminotransferase class V-fold PLP-dependent enzyme [Saccharopolyspora indica]MDA3643111.1 aminotransferase class V-fold PLP-dependent enzyme [Saccharopolyspora indica]